MTEPHETFTWYDSKPYIIKTKDGYMIEDTSIYLSKRNKRIATRRALYTLAVLMAVWGLVCLIL